MGLICRSVSIGPSHRTREHVWHCALQGEVGLWWITTSSEHEHQRTPLCRKWHPHAIGHCQVRIPTNDSDAIFATYVGSRDDPLEYTTSEPRLVAVGLPREVHRREVDEAPRASKLSSRGVENGGERPSTPSLLTFVQGFRHSIEYALQAAIFRLDQPSEQGENRQSVEDHSGALLRSDLLLHCNNAAMSTAELLRFAAKYPQRGVRALVHTRDNTAGYTCGHLHAIASTAAVWAPYRQVLFLHPDVYLPPRAARWIAVSMEHASSDSHAFLVTRLTPRMLRNATTGRLIGLVKSDSLYSTDLFVFRPAFVLPPLAQSAARATTTSATNAPPARGDAMAHASGGEHHPGVAAAAAATNTTPPSLWHNVCATPNGEKVRWPERSLWRLVTTHALPTHVLGTRDTSIDTVGDGMWDGYGVWHAHDSVKVAAVLDRARAKVGSSPNSAAWRAFWLRKKAVKLV